MPSYRDLRERFEARVARSDGCWEWQGSRTRQGYGQIGASRRRLMLKAHRVAYELHVGPIPAGMCVLHRCDNPSCVRPDHLYLGTNADNVADREAKGRHHPCVGPLNPSAKVTLELAQEVVSRVAAGERQYRVAESVGLHASTVNRICRGNHWTTRGVAS